ncbi:MAG: hypothetical protein AB7S26_39715 [Sandaracinaceae bacterium]
MALVWKDWSELSSTARRRTASEVVDSLRTVGHELGAPRLVSFGPPDDAREVAIIEDVKRGVWFSLVPGGVFEPGLDVDGLAAFSDLELAWREALELEDGAELPYTATTWSSEQLRRGAAVEIPSLLVAIQPLHARALGVASPGHSRCPLMSFDDAQAAATRLGYRVPSSAELEWATTAGRPSLFYWGDALPHPMDPRSEWTTLEDFEIESNDFADEYMSISASEVAPWPTSNRFGLQGAAGQPVWCAGPRGEPLVAGGADRFFPWQGCGEWLWLIPSVRVDARSIREHHEGAMLRPVITVPGR